MPENCRIRNSKMFRCLLIVSQATPPKREVGCDVAESPRHISGNSSLL